MQIQFDEEKHEYSVDGVKVPSVSEILRPLSADRYGKIDPFVLKAAAEKGTAVHEATRQIDYGFKPEEDFITSPYIKAYYMFLREVNPEWEMIEKVVGYFPISGEPPIYAGTIDRYGKIDGKPCVVDIKTYASLDTEAQISASCQTALYRDAIESQWLADGVPEMVKGLDAYDGDGCLIRRYVLHLKSDGNYRFASLDSFDKERGFNSSAVAWQLYNLYSDLKYARDAKRKKK